MDLLFFIFIIVIILFGAAMSICKKTRKTTSFKYEKKRYFQNMHKLGLRHWEIVEHFNDVQSFDELIKINKELEKACKVL